MGWLQSCLACLHVAAQAVLPCREAAGTAKGLEKFYRLSRAAAKLCVIHSASLLPSLSITSQRKKAGDSLCDQQGVIQPQTPMGTRWNRSTSGTQPSLPTSLQPPVTHPLTTAQIHFSVSQASWITLFPMAREHLAPLTPSCSHSPVFDFPAYELDHAAHGDHWEERNTGLLEKPIQFGL